jgi:hypothetical protein
MDVTRTYAFTESEASMLAEAAREKAKGPCFADVLRKLRPGDLERLRELTGVDLKNFILAGVRSNSELCLCTSGLLTSTQLMSGEVRTHAAINAALKLVLPPPTGLLTNQSVV